MKYAAAYTLLVLGGNATPSAADLAKVIEASGGECDTEAAEKLVSELSAKVTQRSLKKSDLPIFAHCSFASLPRVLLVM